MPSQSWSGTVTDGSSWVWPEPMCGQCGSGYPGTWVHWAIWYSVAMTIDDQESAGAARPGHGAGAWGRQAWGMGHCPGPAAGRSMSMSIEHDLPRR